MKAIKITYTADNKEWTDKEFEDELKRTFYITFDMLKDLIEANNKLSKGEFISEINDIKIVV